MSIPALITFSLLVWLPVSLNAKDAYRPFEILNLHIGQPIPETKKEYPSMQCKNSCVVEEQKAFGKPGLLWIGVEEGKVSQLAFGFKPDLSLEEGAKVRSVYIEKYGNPVDPLEPEGCDEWVVNGGYLVICFTGNTSPNGDISHIWWNTKSLVDVNKRQQK
jgi:hypothetical protein